MEACASNNDPNPKSTKIRVLGLQLRALEGSLLSGLGLEGLGPKPASKVSGGRPISKDANNQRFLFQIALKYFRSGNIAPRHAAPIFAELLLLFW